jgi:hypothetical protein
MWQVSRLWSISTKLRNDTTFGNNESSGEEEVVTYFKAVFQNVPPVSEGSHRNLRGAHLPAHTPTGNLSHMKQVC